MEITFSHDQNETDFTVSLSSSMTLVEAHIEVFKTTSDNGAETFKSYAESNGFREGKDLLVVLNATHDSNASTATLNYTQAGLTNQCDQNPGGPDCYKLFTLLYKTETGANQIIGHKRSGSKVKDEMGGGDIRL